MKRRILLAEDELSISLTLKAILEIHGFEVETALSAREAVAKLQTFTYEMVITDMKMEEDWSGYRVIRAARNTPYMPAIMVLTAHPHLGCRWRYAGAHAILIKPTETDYLLRQVNALLFQCGKQTPRDNPAQPHHNPKNRNTGLTA
jgi:DNA-binding response OmpR family regulator